MGLKIEVKLSKQWYSHQVAEDATEVRGILILCAGLYF